MPDLLDLPNELLLRVVSTLPRSQDVAAVAATCKLLNHVASGELYENIRLQISGPGHRKDLGVIVKLASSVFVGDPVLRNSTKTISITIPDVFTRYLPRLAPPEIQNMISAAGSEEMMKRWCVKTSDQRANLRGGHIWAYLALLLHACRNIRSLRLDGNFFVMLDFWQTDLDAFEKLETVELLISRAPSIPRPPPSAVVIAGLSHIPNLKTLRLTASGDWISSLRPVRRSLCRTHYPPFAHLTALALWKCELRMLAIRALLGHMPRLVSLEIDLLFALDPNRQRFVLKWCLIDMRRLRKAILGTGLGGDLRKYRKEGLHCSSTLEHLKISVDFACKSYKTSPNRLDYDNQVLPEQAEEQHGWDDSDSDGSSEGEDDDDDDDDDDEEDDNENESEGEGEEGFEIRRYGSVCRVIECPPNPRGTCTCTTWEINRLGSLKGLKKLKTLEIEPMLLFGYPRSAPIPGHDETGPRQPFRWTPLDTLLPDTLEEFRIANGPVRWVLFQGDQDFSKWPGVGADLGDLFDIFLSYKEGGGSLPNLRKVVHMVRASPRPSGDLSWNEQQTRLKDMLKGLGVDYEYPC
ncbi:uncharacterized protein BKCO1_4300057 [Diplodia corticola]|uniref:F-box domain-containing protein n=1 Tax=Diplodia corticola TaxID=236234 RepID=A0A1J9RU40_9PEZI|nr:uncharacterized protein BKCO1_4300057 [Diplodia corticola]OJD31943.1 hypothetical protein BKCO1_4300057 [Diplodia corticola]